MKGIFFTELLEMIEQEHGLGMVDKTICSAVPPTVGVYTSMGNYPTEQFFGLIRAFVALADHPADKMLQTFGRHIFRCMLDRNENILGRHTTTIKALGDIEEILRASRLFSFEKKIPKVEYTQVAPMAGQLLIKSRWPVRHMVHGAIEACIAQMDESLEIQVTEAKSDEVVSTKFDISPKAPSCLTTFS